MDVSEKLKKFIQKRPPVVAAYGYGSGVFKQTGYEGQRMPQIDMILIVENVRRWHQENKKKNPGDYSWTGACLLPSIFVNLMSGKTHIIYQSNIQEEGSVYKYGIISETDFEKCMTTWESFYVPGRFQKPLLPIVETSKIQKLIWENRKNAVLAAACFSSARTTCFDLYMQICNLSYFGDSRMYIAENPEKVRNIVTGSYDRIHEIYKPILEDNEFIEVLEGEQLVIDQSTIALLSGGLPSSLKQYLDRELGILRNIEPTRNAIRSFFSSKNFRESIGQTAKGILSNGPIRSVAYVIPKLKKKLGAKSDSKK